MTAMAERPVTDAEMNDLWLVQSLSSRQRAGQPSRNFARLVPTGGENGRPPTAMEIGDELFFRLNMLRSQGHDLLVLKLGNRLLPVRGHADTALRRRGLGST